MANEIFSKDMSGNIVPGTMVPSFWSATLLEDLKKELVFGSLTNSQYIGEVRYGQSVKVFNVSGAAITDYNPVDGFGTGWTPSRAAAQQVTTLTIDKAKAFQFFIEDLEDRAVLVDLMSVIMRETTYGLRDTVDQYIAGLFESDAVKFAVDGTGNEVGVGLSSSYTFYDLLVDVDTLLNKNNVPRSGRWIVVPPELRALLLKDNRFISNASSPQAYASLLNGEIGQAAGFTIKTSNNISPLSGGLDEYIRFYAGTNEALAFAYDIEKIETYRPENRFADAVKGLFVFGAKVIRPICAYKVAVKLPPDIVGHIIYGNSIESGGASSFEIEGGTTTP